MIDITWKVFSQTGNIETYLLLKEMENVDKQAKNNEYVKINEEESETFNKIY